MPYRAAAEAGSAPDARQAPCRTHVKPTRVANRNQRLRDQWWHYDGVRVGLRSAVTPLDRYIATTITAKHRCFVWMDTCVLPDATLVAVARAVDVTFGCLHSKVHELWSLAVCSWMGVGNDPRYVHTETFGKFPFPVGITPADTAHQRTEPLPDGALIPADLPPAVREHASAIALAAKRLVDLRDAWLNPPEWCERVLEVVPLGMDHSPYPDRIVNKAAAVWTCLPTSRSATPTCAKPSMPAGAIFMSERLPKHFDDALHAAKLALRFLRGRSLEQYLADHLIRSAVERQVEIVGEACRRALDDSPDLLERLADAAFAVAMRNRIAHGYDTVDDKVVFDTVTSSFPPLQAALQRELDRLA